MSKEFIWAATVDGEKQSFRVVVGDEVCRLYEGDTLIQKLKIRHEAEGSIKIDEPVTVWGHECQFQLDNGVPYLKMGDKWTASDTTNQERQEKKLHILKLSVLVQVGGGLLGCLIYLIVWLTGGNTDRWIYLLALGAMIAVTGLLQAYNIKVQMKQAEEDAKKG